MDDPNEISYIRVDILENWRFWNKYRQAGDIEGAGREVLAQADALLALSGNERAESLIKESRTFRLKKQIAGQKGGKTKAANKAQSGRGGTGHEEENPDTPAGNNNNGHEQRPAVTEAGSGNAMGGLDSSFSSVPATFDGAAGSPGGTPPQQPPAGKPRRPSPDMLRGYTIPEMGEVWDFVHEVGIPESIASEWFEWMDGQRKWPPLKKGWKVALRGFAKKKEEE